MNIHTLFYWIILIALLLNVNNICFSQVTAENDAIDLYLNKNYYGAIALFSDILSNSPNNVRALTWCAEAFRRIDSSETAIAYARRVLLLDSCNPMALTTIADSYNPQFTPLGQSNYDSTWLYLNKAFNCDKYYGGMLTGLYFEAMRRNDSKYEKLALENLYKSGFFTTSTVAYNRWVLESLPPNCILITNGDMDTYPVIEIQQMENLRKDVTVINNSLLELPWYSAKIFKELNIPLVISKDERKILDDTTRVIHFADIAIPKIIKSLQSQKIERSLAFALTTEVYAAYSNNLTFIGTGWLYTYGKNITDYNAIEKNLRNIKIEDFIAPVISDQDKSPIRRNGSNGLKLNILYVAGKFIKHCKDEKETEKAKEFIKIFRQFVVKTLPLEIQDRISDELKLIEMN
jgi:tetratricopeptide (TPR) repeat protein